MRLIDADELIEHVWRDKLDSRELIAEMINNAPTVKEIPTNIPISIFERLISQEPCSNCCDGNQIEKAKLCQKSYLAGMEHKQEACEDVISRQAALEKVRAMQTYKLFVGDDMILVDKAVVQTELMMLPTAQPERKNGKWIFDEVLDRHYYCSECKSMGVDYWDYCPNCGAKMVEPQESEDKE